MPPQNPVPQLSEPPIGGNTLRAPLAVLRQALARQERRRRRYHGGALRVGWEDDTGERCNAEGRVGEPFRVPLRASYLDIMGEDAEGTLLLAMVPLPAPALVAATRTQHLAVTLEGGQTVTIDVALGQRAKGIERAYVIQLAYRASAVLALLPAGPPFETSP
jgi:hypothetical protein